MEKWSARAASVTYWNKNAKWYKLWVEHNSYHKQIIEILTSHVLPGWKVLDIGAGNGILSFPLSAAGCRVTALEPSEGMRKLLENESWRWGNTSIRIESRRWEDMPLGEIYDFDLIIASNSLHLTEIGFISALEKIFLARPLHAFIISEKQFLDYSPGNVCDGYMCYFEERYSAGSSYAYHCLEDAFEHWSFKHQRQPDPSERLAIISGLADENGHLWSRGSATVCMNWWARNNAVPYSNITIKEANHVYQDIFLPFSSHDFSSFC